MNERTPPARGFTPEELEARTHSAQAAMHEAGLDALFLTTEPEFRYFTGFLSQFWESPTRPWYLVVPSEGKPIAVVPEIGAAGIAGTWLEDIRTWPAPRPQDDGLELLAETLKGSARRSGRIGVPLGHESTIRMPGQDYLKLTAKLTTLDFVDARALVRGLRAIKSDAEIDKIRHCCQLVNDGFEALPAALAPGMTERQACKALQIDVLQRGVDATPYLIGVAGPESYDNIIMGPSDRILDKGDVLVIDTGCTFDGYFCDFDRNFAFGRPTAAAERAYRTVYAATNAGFAAARPGATTRDVWHAMWSVMEADGALGNGVGRLGHGLGMQLTEWPSNKADDPVELTPGMVLTLEPGMAFAPGKLMVHEENIAIREGGAEWLTRRAPPDLTTIS